MLDEVGEAPRERVCLCVPFAQLQSFYGRIGFRTLADGQAPSFLGERAAEYRESGYDVVVMCRGAASSTGSG